MTVSLAGSLHRHLNQLTRLDAFKQNVSLWRRPLQAAELITATT